MLPVQVYLDVYIGAQQKCSSEEEQKHFLLPMCINSLSERMHSNKKNLPLACDITTG